jgi:hypothetical protein
MDIFLIHGVNKRQELGHTFAGAPGSGGSTDRFVRRYEREIQGIEKVFSLLCQAGNFEGFRLCPIYWGAHGARFHFYERTEVNGKLHYEPLVQQRSLANVKLSRTVRSQGAGDHHDGELRAVAEDLELIAGQLGRPGATLLELTLAAPASVLEALVAPEHALRRADRTARLEASAAVARLSRRIAEDQALRSALEKTKDAGDGADLALVDLLQRELSRRDGERSQGGGWALTTARRFATGWVARQAKSERTYLNGGRFFGDSVRYFTERGTKAAPGPIIEAVKSQIQAWGLRPGPRVFITHSLGGAVFYDLFTHFEPDLRFDLWLSVGSQLGYYEDAKLLAHSSAAAGAYPGAELPGVPRKVTAPLPPGAVWLNLFDARDPLAFAAEDAFANVRDEPCRLMSGDFAEIHNAYLYDPHFYVRVGSILAQVFDRPGAATVDEAIFAECPRAFDFD